MITKQVTVRNKSGIHARPAMILVEAASQFKCEIYLIKGEDRANAKSILNVMMLAAAFGTSMTLETEGEDEVEAAESLCELFEHKFKMADEE